MAAGRGGAGPARRRLTPRGPARAAPAAGLAREPLSSSFPLPAAAAGGGARAPPPRHGRGVGRGGLRLTRGDEGEPRRGWALPALPRRCKARRSLSLKPQAADARRGGCTAVRYLRWRSLVFIRRHYGDLFCPLLQGSVNCLGAVISRGLITGAWNLFLHDNA